MRKLMLAVLILFVCGGAEAATLTAVSPTSDWRASMKSNRQVQDTVYRFENPNVEASTSAIHELSGLKKVQFLKAVDFSSLATDIDVSVRTITGTMANTVAEVYNYTGINLSNADAVDPPKLIRNTSITGQKTSLFVNVNNDSVTDSGVGLLELTIGHR